MISKTIRADIQKFCDHIDTARWTEFIREYEKIGEHPVYGCKHAGSDAEHEGSRFISNQLKEIGIPKVEFIENKTARYQFNDATLTVTKVPEGASIDDKYAEIKPYGYRSVGTSPEGITAQLVDAGTATRDEFKPVSAGGKGLDIEGKVALFKSADGALSIGTILPQIEEAIKNKPVAILIYCPEDVLNDDTIRVQTPLNSSPIPIMGISINHAKYLLGLLEKGDVEVNLTVDADYDPDNGVTYNVVGEIPGEISEEKIIFSAHLDHFFKCINDNMTSCAAFLAIAEAILKSGYKPKRSIIFQFNGSHECGIADCKQPYINGAYYVIQAKGDEWKHKAIANINFEYVGLPLDELRSVTGIGNEGILRSYDEYSPELTGGFKKKNLGYGMQGYYGLSWCDGICYYTAGIPTYINDPETQQMEGNSPYAGRDHSQHENWDIFSEDALRDSIRHYGGLAIYLDSMPYMEADFSEQSRRMHDETQFDELDKEGIRTSKMRATLEALNEASAGLLARTRKANEAYLQALDEAEGEIELAQQKAAYDAACVTNRKVLQLFDYFQANIDGVSPGDYVVSRSGKYLMNVAQFGEAQEALEKGDAETAKDKLLEVDLAGVSYLFSEEIVDKMRAQAIGPEYAHKRTWTRGRELKCATHYQLMTGLKRKLESGEKDFKAELKLIKKANMKEMLSFILELRKEFKVIKKAIGMIKEI